MYAVKSISTPEDWATGSGINLYLDDGRHLCLLSLQDFNINFPIAQRGKIDPCRELVIKTRDSLIDLINKKENRMNEVNTDLVNPVEIKTSTSGNVEANHAAKQKVDNKAAKEAGEKPQTHVM